MKIYLTRAEWMQAAFISVMKTIQNHKDGATPKDGIPDNIGWDSSIEGDCGEMAFAKFLGVFWSGNVGNRKARDVAGFQVKTTRTPFLILRERDPRDAVYVCLQGQAPAYNIAGWYYGDLIFAARDTYYKDQYNNGRPAYFFPQHLLNRINAPSDLPHSMSVPAAMGGVA